MIDRLREPITNITYLRAMSRRIGPLVLLVLACGSPQPPPPPSNTTLPATPPSGVASDPSSAPSPQALAVTSVEPSKGDSQGGTYVVIKGRRFLADGPRMVKIYFGSRQGSVVRFASDSELIVEAPGGKVGETVDVRLVFEPGGQLQLEQAFTFVDVTNAP